jgi:DNA-binding transcriptional ArsR family regulator
MSSVRADGSSTASPESNGDASNGSWTFLSNHAHVLVCLARDPDARLRDLAERVGITERGVFRVVSELERAGIIRRIREGRRNRYEIDPSAPLRHQVEAAQTVGGLLALFLKPVECQRLGLTGGNVPP